MRRIELLSVIVVLGLASAARGQDGGFTEQLNGIRSSRGLGAVVYDGNASGIAASNNAAQRQRGLGHFVTGGLAQCSAAVGPNPLPAWLASPAHAAYLLHPGLTSVGYACDGLYATAACAIGVTAPGQSVPYGSGACQSAPVQCFARPRWRLFRRW